jgi:exodeoxyribonuclease VII large subunit
MSKTFMDDDSPNDPGLLATEMPGDNAPPFSVSELSSVLKRTIEGAFDHVRVRGEISGLQASWLGPLLFHPQGRCRLHRRR